MVVAAVAFAYAKGRDEGWRSSPDRAALERHKWDEAGRDINSMLVQSPDDLACRIILDTVEEQAAALRREDEETRDALLPRWR